MKKLLVVVIVIALVVWVISWFRAPEAVSTSVAKPWPAELGTLDDAAKRWPPQQTNGGAAKLTALASALPKNEAVDAFVARELAKGELAIGDAPALPDVAPIRELLLREPISWKSEEGVGGGDPMNAMRAMQLTVARALVASALAKARANDPAAWEDLHAVWKLARTLDPQPQMMLQTAALTMERMINGVAWKMPLPAPAWLAELQQRDSVPQLLASFHYTADSYADSGMQLFPTKALANSVEHDRAIAEALAKETRCDVTVPMNELGTDLTSVWRRAFRYRAEREATANALRAREGKAIETTSRCTDGTWAFDGTTLRFSREIATAPPDKPMPLVLQVK
ncbi:MAG TPA: hypothetical protein VF618_02270 [Thermoanaerobaculia bacterium]